MAAVRRHRRRGSTGTTSNDNTEDRLKREHFLHPNSDQIDLNRLLQAVLDINEKLNERQPQESVEKPDEIRGGTSAEDQWDDIKDKQDIDDTASRHSVASSSRSRPRSGLINAESRRPTPLERKNMSFSNAKVDAIDRENQRLLREITRTRGRPKSAQKSKLVSEPLRVQTSSEVNRCRFQRKVDMDNQVRNVRLISNYSDCTIMKSLKIYISLVEDCFIVLALHCGLYFLLPFKYLLEFLNFISSSLK